jgi:hypothetical protein
MWVDEPQTIGSDQPHVVTASDADELGFARRAFSADLCKIRRDDDAAANSGRPALLECCGQVLRG